MEGKSHSGSSCHRVRPSLSDTGVTVRLPVFRMLKDTGSDASLSPDFSGKTPNPCRGSSPVC